MERRFFGLIGKSIGHSFSPKYFADKFEKEGIKDAVYQLFPLAEIEEFSALLDNNPAIKGLNVTIPYKKAIIPYLDELSPQAIAVGAVNTIQFVDDKLIGHNTDVWGFEQSLRSCIPSQKENKALILGTGGAALAVAYTLKKMAIPYLFVSRLPKENALIYSEISPLLLAEYSIIINTTPLGMSPNIASCPTLPYASLTQKHLLFDLVYNPTETLFLKKGKEQGASTQNGLEMLQLQADRAWNIWNK